MPVQERSAHAVHDHQEAIAIAFQQRHLEALDSKARLSFDDKHLRDVDRVYGAIRKLHLPAPSGAAAQCVGSVSYTHLTLPTILLV